LELTSPVPEWSPHDPVVAEEESKCTDDEGYVRRFRNNRQVSSVLHDEGSFINGINGCITNHEEQKVSSLEMNISSIKSASFKLTPEVLCKNWGTGKVLPERTINGTTQLRVRTVAHPSIECRWTTGDRHLRYRRLDHIVYHDTMHSKIASSRGNKCCEIYVTDFGWSRVFPM
jgi:hypothetical protein